MSTHHKNWVHWAGALGFHAPMLAFALRTALAAFAALWLAHAVGLEHPHWAAMSVWASSQPLREHLLSRGIYRFGGSVVGVIYAVLLVLLAQDSLWVMALGLAAWGGLCAFWGNLQRGFMVYGWMLAGYSAAMVVLLHHGPADNIWALAWDRMGTVVIGVLAALCISWCFAPRRKAAVLIGQSRNALADVLQAASGQLRESASPAVVIDNSRLLSRLAEVEELLELYPEGSRTARQTAAVMHWQQLHALDLVYHLNRCAAVPAARMPYPALADALDCLVQTLRQEPEADRTMAAMLQHAGHMALQATDNALLQAAGQPAQQTAVLTALQVLLKDMQRAMRVEAQELGCTSAAQDDRTAPLPLHRDWVGAREAGIRATATLLVFGVAWASTGSSVVGFGMLGLTVMLLVFSAFESPSRTMAFVLRGQIIGAALALVCQTLVWPWATSSAAMVWMVLPFALVGGLLFAHKRTAAGALDINMVMFILLAPHFPDTAGWERHLSFALAVVSGPALAWLVYRWIYPTDAVRRMHTVARMMLNEVPLLAQRLLQEGAVRRWSLTTVDGAAQWQARLHHRVLRLVRWADKTGWNGRSQLPAMSMALRSMQATLMDLQQWRTSGEAVTALQRRAQRRAQMALLRTAQCRDCASGKPCVEKMAAAWQALARQAGLPAPLQGQIQQMVQQDIRVLAQMGQALR